MLDAGLESLRLFFSPGPLLAFFLVIPYALLGGLLPAANLPLTIILLGFVGVIDPTVAIVLVVAKGAQGDITEPVPAILMGIPGARAAQATVLDGYPLAQQGKAAWALGASYTTTLIGGIIGAIALLVALPVAANLLQYFGSAEFFLLAMTGVLGVAVVSSGALVKGLLSGSLGLLIATLGFSPISGIPRAHFGIDYLWDGVSLIPVIVGVFALPEVIGLVVSNKAIARDSAEDMLKGSAARNQAFEGMREAFRHKWLMLRSSLIGVAIGIMPGVGGATAHWIAYAQARQTEKGAIHTFGKGDIRGVIAADCPNNSIDGAALIPTLLFSIPGTAHGAIFLALLILMGYIPGPAMVNEHLDITLLMVLVIALSNIVVVPIMIFLAGPIARFTSFKPGLIAPFIITIVLLSSFQASQSLGDLVVVLGFAVLGLFMKAYGWPRAPILIAVVLGEILEKYLWLARGAYGWAMFTRPQFLIIFAVILAIIAWSVRVQMQANRAASEIGNYQVES